MNNRIAWLILVNILCIGSLQAQSFIIHSHNDYLQSVPFWKAYSTGASSIEVDIFLHKGSLLVAHDKEDLPKAGSLEELYLEPLVQSMKLEMQPDSLQLLIDIKSEPYATLDAIVEVLGEYSSIIQNNSIKLIISGNRPKLSDFVNYPEYIYFDYQSLDKIEDQKILDKIALISLNFKAFTEWNGKGRLIKEDLSTVSEVVDQAQALGKPFRFWATPDSKTSWKAMTVLGVDFINTDQPFECSQYLKTLPKRVYKNETFSEVYKPTFKSDGRDRAPKNIILLIGDGNGLSQISATAIANGGQLTLTQLKNIGLIKTHSSDDLTTDSAAGATAMATGKKVPNRAIGLDDNGNSLPNLTEILDQRGYSIALITSDEITGATPSAFYAHQKDRSMNHDILEDFLKSPVSIFVASSGSYKAGQEELGSFKLAKNLDDIRTKLHGKVGYFLSPDDSPAPLSLAFNSVVDNLTNRNKPFFLMLEGAKIDSYGHSNEISGLIKEGIAFDRAVSEALKFADVDENTLVLITADHETGGLTIPQGNLRQNIVEADFTTDDHTAAFVPLFAYGPGSQKFQGVYENNEIFDKILEALNKIR